MEICKWCGLQCKKFFCSKKCNNGFHKNRITVDISCPQCFRIVRTQIPDKYTLCKSCTTSNRKGLSGDKNPAWRGGFKYWQEGRLGRDKDGLSWKKQRRLTWERDKYTCQICGKQKNKRNPDVHHKVPYRISKSHALENLISLCKKCHKIEDEKYKQFGVLNAI